MGENTSYTADKGLKRTPTAQQQSNPGKTWATDKYFSKDEISKASKHMKTCSGSLANREMQIKTTMRFHIAPARMAYIQKPTYSNC